MPQDFTQLGIAGLSLGILFFIVRYFVKAMSEKDTYIQKITTDFTTIVEGHLKNAAEARALEAGVLAKVTEVLYKNTDVLNKHTEYLINIEMNQQQKRGKLGRRKYDKIT